jgi:hypothetical protein
MGVQKNHRLRQRWADGGDVVFGERARVFRIDTPHQRRAAMRLALAVARPARTSATNCSMLKPCASMIASVQPSDAASSSSARRRSGFRRRFLVCRWFARELIKAIAHRLSH